MSIKRTILVTGCSDGGLGAALALALQKNGWRVLASARNPDKLRQVKAAGIETVSLDVLSVESIASAVSQVRELTGGSLDVLVNNAGGGYSMPLIDVDLAVARRLYDLNVFSIISVTRAFLPLLFKSSIPGGGMVVNNTSGAGLSGGSVPLQAIYNSSKAAAISVTEGLRLELQPFGIRVLNLVTGGVKSSFFDNAPDATLPAGSLYRPAKEAIERALSGADLYAAGATAESWAEKVAKDLSKSSPPYLIWRGAFASVIRLGSHFPIGWLDGALKNGRGLDVLESKIKEQGGANKLKFA